MAKKFTVELHPEEAYVVITDEKDSSYYKGLYSKEDLKDVIGIYIDDFIKDKEVRI